MGATHYAWRYSDHSNATGVYAPLAREPARLLRWSMDNFGALDHKQYTYHSPLPAWLPPILAVAVVGGHMKNLLGASPDSIGGRFTNFTTTLDYKLLSFTQYD